jgi:hypothetical protein
MVTMTSKKTLVVNTAFLQEIKDSNPGLWHSLRQLRQLCQSGEDPIQTARRLVRVLDELREKVATQFALEESFGYIEVPVTYEPSIASEFAESVKNQHYKLYLNLSELAERAEEVQYRGAIHERLPSLIASAKHFDEEFRTHELLEAKLIDQSFDLPCRNYV